MNETTTQQDSPNDEIRDEVQETHANMDTLTFKRTHVYAALLPLAFVVGLAAGYLFWGREVDPAPMVVAQTEEAAPEEAAPDPQPQQVRRYEVSEDDDPVYGPDDAAITIIEFSDYECPYCRRWHVEVWPQLLEAYPGQIRLVYRDFPLTNIHANATPAASAANCARDQDMFWEFNEKLFGMAYDLNINSYRLYAEELGLDMTAFNDCLESGDYNEEVQSDQEYAASLGVRSTPTFFVNGIPVVGAQPFDVFSQLIDQELAGEIP